MTYSSVLTMRSLTHAHRATEPVELHKQHAKETACGPTHRQAASQVAPSPALADATTDTTALRSATATEIVTVSTTAARIIMTYAFKWFKIVLNLFVLEIVFES